MILFQNFRRSVAISSLGAAFALPGAVFAQDAPRLHEFSDLAVSPDGRIVAALEGTETARPGERTVKHLVLRPAHGGPAITVSTPDCPDCDVTSPAWTPDSGHIAFILRRHGAPVRRIMEEDSHGGSLTTLLSFEGSLQALRFSARGDLAVLAIAGARRDPGALEAGAPITGEIDAQQDEQRIATVSQGAIQWQSPADLYVYEYDWRSGEAGGALRFVGTAAPGNGDEHWWQARLSAFEGGKETVLYTPPQDRQLGLPRVSPDGRTVAFIGGLMSDFGFFGGDVFSLALDGAGAKPLDLTPGLPATVTALSWCGPALTAAGLAGAQTAFWSLGNGAPQILERDADLLSTGGGQPGFACGGKTLAVVRQNFTRAPVLAAGPVGHFSVLSHDNDAMPANATARSVEWTSEGFRVQGWLLSPIARKAGAAGANGKVAMVVDIHGGPSAAATPRYLRARAMNKSLLDAGYDVFLPNPRGSYGQGEAFTHANRRDFGYGDLRDILHGIDAVERIEPVDDARLGVTGYSYGGYMTMWTVTQTTRFRAAVAGGGIGDWQSYYGQNGIDGWMPPFFGATVYDDPAIYAKSSPISFIKKVRTPTLIYVGGNDEECPPAQSLEFYHALKALGVETKLVIYPGEGHALRDPKHSEDAARRTVAWFDAHLAP